MKGEPQVDVSVVCALGSEARAFLDMAQQHFAVSFEEKHHALTGDSRLGQLVNRNQESLSLHVSWLPRLGPQEITLYLTQLLQVHHPRMVVLAGMCAGDPKHVQLGDLVVADRVYPFDMGPSSSMSLGESVPA
jgi:nucleoside phosphorylase